MIVDGLFMDTGVNGLILRLSFLGFVWPRHRATTSRLSVQTMARFVLGTRFKIP